MDKPLILAVDDEPSVADSLAGIITKSGKYDAVAAYSGKEAFEQLKKHRQLFGVLGNRIKLILLDIKMPDMDGLQFLEKLRKDYGDEKIGVMMVTAYEDTEKWDRATSGFVCGYIKKPIIEKDIMAAVDRFFSEPEACIGMTMETFEKHIDKKDELRKQDKQS